MYQPLFADKEVETVTGILGPAADNAYACENSSSRSAPAARVVAGLVAAGTRDVRSFPNVAEAVQAARAAAAEDDLILVTGSFYTVADARPLFVASST